MTVLLISIYVIAFVLEIGGGWVVAADIIKDKKDMKKVLEDREATASYGSITFSGGAIGGAMGAMLAQGAARQNVMDEFTLGRIRSGYKRRWWGVALVALGAFAGTVGNVVSTFA